jgi:hypothetical protein
MGDGSMAPPVIPAQAGISLPQVIKARISRLKAMTEKCSLAYKKRFLNKSLEVLLEAPDKQNPLLWEGLTDNYLKVKLPLMKQRGRFYFSKLSRAGLNLPYYKKKDRTVPFYFKNKMVLARLLRIIGDSFIGEYIDKF